MTLWTIARQALLPMGFPRQEYWSRLPFPSPGDLSDPRIKPGAPALQADSLPTELWGKPIKRFLLIKENWIFQVKEFSAFLCMGRCKSLGPLKSYLWLGVSILASHKYPHSVPLELLQQLTDRWGASGFHPEFPQGSPSGGCNVMTWWLQHALFTDMAGNIFHSHSDHFSVCIHTEHHLT